VTHAAERDWRDRWFSFIVKCRWLILTCWQVSYINYGILRHFHDN